MKLPRDLRTFPVHTITTVVIVVTMIAMGVAALIIPPPGVIDSSVIEYSALMCVPLVVSQIRPIMREAKQLRIQKGDITIEATAADTHTTSNQDEE